MGPGIMAGMTFQASGSFDIEAWDADKPYVEQGGNKLTRVHVGKTFHGDLVRLADGSGHAHALPAGQGRQARRARGPSLLLLIGLDPGHVCGPAG